jgi:hypothetical protein
MNAVEQARAEYRWWATEPVDPTDQHEWLWMEALSVALDCATAAQFDEYRGPHPTFLRQPESRP